MENRKWERHERGREREKEGERGREKGRGREREKKGCTSGGLLHKAHSLYSKRVEQLSLMFCMTLLHLIIRYMLFVHVCAYTCIVSS